MTVIRLRRVEMCPVKTAVIQMQTDFFGVINIQGISHQADSVKTSPKNNLFKHKYARVSLKKVGANHIIFARRLLKS